MKDWKMWAPLQSKKQREVADNLSVQEKEEVIKISKELGKKGANYGFLAFLLIYILYKYTALPSNIKLLLSIAIVIIDYTLFLKFIGLPYRKKQKSILNNSKYAKEKKITV
jgi:hypothetical protein